MRSRGRRSSGCSRGEEYKGLLVRLRCRRRRIIGGVGEWSGGMAWPAVGVVGGGEASAASQPATGGRSTRHDRRWFGRLEQEDQRLKKHYGRWMDIVRSQELESFILTKLTKPSVPVNLVGPQVTSHYAGFQLAGGVFIFLCIIRRHFLACEDSWWVRPVSGGNVFFAKYRSPSHVQCTYSA